MFSVLLLVIIASSCSSNNGSLTKAEALAILKQKDIDKPMQKIKGIFVGKISFKRSGTGLTEIKYLNTLKQNGAIILDSVVRTYSGSTERKSSESRVTFQESQPHLLLNKPAQTRTPSM